MDLSQAAAAGSHVLDRQCPVFIYCAPLFWRRLQWNGRRGVRASSIESRGGTGLSGVFLSAGVRACRNGEARDVPGLVSE